MGAQSKAEATARMYELAGEPVEPLGPGSKEKRSALEALGRAVGVDLVDVRGKVECGRRLSARLDVVWDEDCYSTGDTITLTGMNRLLDGVDRPGGVTDAGLGQARHDRLLESEASQVSTDRPDLERIVAEAIAELSRSDEGPVEVGSPPPSPIEPDAIQFDDGSWRTHLASVAEWLHLAQNLDVDSEDEFDSSLARGLGLDEGWAGGASDPLSERLLPRLADRLDKAIALRGEFEA